MKKLFNKKGFTIVELVIVIAVIAILAAVLIPTFSNLTEKANESAALQAANNEYKNWQIDYSDTDKTVEGSYFVVEQNGDEYFFKVEGSKLVYQTTDPTGTKTEVQEYVGKWDAKVKIYNIG